jgi:uncharacterized membrane protein YdjX (TVP38/TMEM64 family)
MKRKYVIRLFTVIILGTAIVLAFYYRERLQVSDLADWLQGFGFWSVAIFIGIYAIAAVLLLPGSLLTITGGILFGPLWGALYNLTGATLGATASFLIARYLASDWVRRKTGSKLSQIINGIEEESWRFVAFVRLVPLFPFNMTNYALGLTGIRLLQYIVVSFFCMIPGAFAYTYLGAVAQGALADGSNTGILVKRAMLALGLMAFVLFLPRIVKRLRKKDKAIKTV